MAAPTPASPSRTPGNDWLAESAPRPELAHEMWDIGALVPLDCSRWLVAEVQLQAAMEAVQRVPTREQGPLLVDFRSDRAWWLVPLDADEQLADVRQVTVLRRDIPLHCPPTHRAVGSRVWLEAPDGSGRVMDPVYLAAALGPGGPRLPAEAFG